MSENLQHPMVKLFNPSLTDTFTTTYDINEDGNPLTYSIEPLDIKAFPAPVAEHILNHLAYKIAKERTKSGTNYEIERAKAIKEIQVGE